MKENLLLLKDSFGTLKNKIYKHITSVLKNAYIDKLDDIVNKYNNTYHSSIKMKLVDVKSSKYITLVKKLMIKILNLKLVILLECHNIKNFLEKATFQVSLKKFLWLIKLKTLYRGHMLLGILKTKKLLKHFTRE